MPQTLKTIIDEYKKDSLIQQHMLDVETVNTTQLHSKYMGYLMEAREELRELK